LVRDKLGYQPLKTFSNLLRLRLLIASYLFLILLFMCNEVEAFFRIPEAALPLESNAGYEKTDDRDRRVLLLFMDGVTPEELFEYAGPRLQEIMRQGSIGLLNSRTAGDHPASGHLTMGAGARGIAGEKGAKAFTREEKYQHITAANRYHSNLGTFPGGEIVHPYIHYLKEKNKQLEHQVEPGHLGEALNRKGLKTAYFGHADTAQRDRSAVLTVMNKSGTVNYGETLISREASSFPYGQRVDAMKTAEEVKGKWEQASLLAVDWGDTVRLDDKRQVMAEERVQEVKKKIFKELDLFLEKISRLFDNQTMLILASANPPQRHFKGGRLLLPVVISSPDHSSGILKSSTTQRKGLAANLDLAPTILEFLQLPSSGEAGRTSMETIEHPQPEQYLTEMYQTTARIKEQRPFFLRPYVLIQIILVLGGLLFITRLWQRHKKYFIAMLEASMLIPAAFLVLGLIPGYPFNSPWLSALAVLLLVGGGLGGLNLLKKKQSGRMLFWAVLGLIISLSLVLELLTGASLQPYSFLGYDLVAGSRYYGIGNEYMGVLLGATVLGVSSLWGYFYQRYPHWFRGKDGKKLIKMVLCLLTGYSLLVVLVLASPGYGANVGGSISAAVAMGFLGTVMLTSLSDYSGKAGLLRGWLPVSLLLAGVFLLVVVTYWWYHLNFTTQGHWHLQAFWDQLWERGGEGLEEVIRRKLNMNLSLIRYSIWTRMVVVFLGVLGVFCYYPAGAMKSIRENNVLIYRGLNAVVVGAAVALLVNDSGVVAAATTLLYGVPPLLIFLLEENLSVNT